MGHRSDRKSDETTRRAWMLDRQGGRSTLSKLKKWSLSLLVAILLPAIGIVCVIHEVHDTNDRLRSELMAWAQVAVHQAALNDVRLLKGVPADESTEPYTNLEKALIQIRASRPELRFTYVLGIRENVPFFYGDSEPDAAPEKSRPGDPYPEMPGAAKALFKDGRAIVTGPFRDRWGEWVSVFVRVPSSGADQAPAVFGADTNAALWHRQVFWHCLPEILVVAALVTLLLVCVLAMGLTRRQAERIIHSEQTLHNLTVSVSDRLWQTDAAMNYIYCSGRTKEIMGYSPDEMLGRNMAEFAAPEEKERVNAFLAGVLESRKPFRQFEHWVLHKDGRRVCLLTSGTPELDTEGNLLGYRGIDSDTTERRLIEDSLTKRDQLLEAATEAANHLLADSQYASGARAALQTLGRAIGADRAYICEVRRDEPDANGKLLVWHAWANPFAADLDEEKEPPSLPGCVIIPRWDDTLNTGLPVAGSVNDLPGEEQLLLRMRRTKSILVAPITILREFWGFACFEDCHSEREWSLGEIMILLSSASAIGATVVRKQTEDGLVESNAWLNGTLKAACGIGIVMTNPAGQVTKFSSGAEHLLGYAAGEVVGRFPLLGFHLESEVRDACAEAGIPVGGATEGFRPIVEFVRRYEVWDREWTYVTKRGARFIARTAIGEARDTAGELRGYVAIITPKESAP